MLLLLLLPLQEVPRWLFPPTIRADQAADITPDEDAAIFTDHSGEHHHHSQDTERGAHSKKVREGALASTRPHMHGSHRRCAAVEHHL